jgi:tetratricopeptide (TPR) repeat protein
MEALGRHADAGKNPAAVTAARSLPGGVPSFTGRRPELERLRRVLQKRTDASSAMRVVAIDGMAGIGKTAFAVHAAHRLASRFPDGQRFLALHGHTPGQLPVSSYDALTALLMADGVAPEQIPADTDARAGLWRAQIAGRKLLLVLDDAVSTEQVRPLLPGTGEALVLITSRRRLTALPATLVLALTILPREEAAQLLVRLSGRSALQPGDSTVVSIAELCGFLPLALSLVAAQLRHHLAWAPGRLAAGLASAADSLPLMAAEDISVAAAFDLSYRNVSDGEQRLFRQLSLHPGTDIDSFAAAALNDTDLTETDTLLNRLFECHLIEEREQGRYAFHDLIRRHARALAAADPEREHEAAIGRLLNYYLQTARAADIRLAGYTPAGVPAVSGSLPAYAPDLPTRAEASAWMGAERSNLQALVGYAAIHDRPDHAIAITAAMQSFLRSAGYWDQAIASQRAALEAARHTHDQLAEAAVLTDLAVTQRNAADFPAATTGLTKALGLYRELANPLGEANALDELGVVQYLSGDYPAATANLARALELYRAVGDRRGQANTLIGLGAALALSGNYPAAISSLTQARELNRYFVSPWHRPTLSTTWAVHSG